MKSLLARYQPGPVVWIGNILVTCLILFAFQKLLWLVVPFVLALVIYYALLPLKFRLVLRGVSHDNAAVWVSLAAFALVLLMLVFGFPVLLAESVTWKATAMRYLNGGLQMLETVLVQLEGEVEMLAEAHVSQAMGQQRAHF